VSVNSGELILPRVANYPKYLTSAGGEVIDLMSDLGRPLDGWQAWIIERGLGQVKDEETHDLVMAADTCGCWVPRQNGKGDIIMALELGWLFLFGVPLIGHSAHLYATAAEGFQRIKVLIEENEPILGSAVQHIWSANGKQGIELTPKYKRARLLFTAREGGQGLGFSFPKLIMDEAQALTAELMQTLAPTQSAMWDPQVWFFGTPPRNDKAWIYKIKQAGEACDPTTAWFDYGIDYINPVTEADEFRRTVGNDETNRVTNPSMGVRRDNRTGIRQRTIDSEIKKLGKSTMAFAMERNGMWLPRARVAGDNAIDPSVWSLLAAARPEVPGDIAVAFHINAKRTHGTIMWAGKIGGIWRIGIAEHRPGVDWIIPRISDMKAKYGPVAFAVDARGESVVKDLKEIGIEVPKDPDRPRRGDLFIPGIDGTAQAFGLLVDSATAQIPMVAHHNEPPLNSAVTVPARPLGGGSTFDHKAGVEVGPACAGGLAMLAYRERIDKVMVEYDPLAFIH
jgi:hypothetical protein